ncbi:DUF3265 domain-containing protein [Vibrio vulnificus]
MAFLVCGWFGGESGLRKVGLCGTHPLTRRYLSSIVQRMNHGNSIDYFANNYVAWNRKYIFVSKVFVFLFFRKRKKSSDKRRY